MTIPRWTPSSEVTKREAFLLKRLQRTKKLFRFLREHRLDLFDTAFQDELASMYRDSDEGKEAVPPAQLAMAILLQAYTGSSDAEAIENTLGRGMDSWIFFVRKNLCQPFPDTVVGVGIEIAAFGQAENQRPANRRHLGGVLGQMMDVLGEGHNFAGIVDLQRD